MSIKLKKLAGTSVRVPKLKPIKLSKTKFSKIKKAKVPKISLPKKITNRFGKKL